MANTTTTSNSSKPASSMAELMSRQTNVQVLQKGQMVEGTIKKLTPQEILMDIGAKGDALVIEFDHQKLENLLAMLKVGDRVKASVISAESEEGFPVVSLRRMLDDIIFSKFEDLVKKEESFEISVDEPTRGGYFASTSEGVKGFLPSSQTTGDNLSGQKIKVKIVEFDRAKKRVVFSQKAIDFVMNPTTIQKYIKRGSVVDAQVATITPYGLYVVITPEKDIRIEGFVHISEIAYERVADLASLYKVGDKIKTEVIEIDDNNRRVNLSVKKTKEDTFVTIRDKYKKEDKLKATVTDVKSRGITLKIADGVNGFIPSDKISSGTEYKVGDIVNTEVVDFDDRRRVIILSPVLKAVPIGYR